MVITQTHLSFWESKQPKPRWAEQLKSAKRWPKVDPFAGIDACVNAHAGTYSGIRVSERYLDVHNLIEICRRHVSDGTLPGLLSRIAANPGTLIRPEKRAALAKRWLRRI